MTSQGFQARSIHFYQKSVVNRMDKMVNDKQVDSSMDAMNQDHKEEDLEMVGQQDEELVEDVLDEVLSEDDDDDEEEDDDEEDDDEEDDDDDDEDLEPRGANVEDFVIDGMQVEQPREQEPVGVVANAEGSAMDVDVFAAAPNKPVEGPPAQKSEPNTKSTNLDNEPPIEGYARYVGVV
jgi:hypothetical protein